MIFLEKDPGNTSTLNLDMLDKTLPYRLGTDGSITCDRTRLPIIEEGNLSKWFQ
jgi:hypothetical protein